MRISLVIPVKNEEVSLPTLIESIDAQTRQPDEIIFVDGGSDDSTASLLKAFAGSRPSVKVLEIGEATPGRGRNVGTEAAESEWIAYTDAGIVLSPEWLENLSSVLEADSGVSAVYGDYDPRTESWFERVSCIAYCAPKRDGSVRGRSIASSLIKREAWRAVGGFPDLRAGEDLIFMENLDAAGLRSATAPSARILWNLQPDSASAFRKFLLYAEKSAAYRRTHDWHVGILRQYLLLLPFVLLAIMHSALWLLVLPLWLVARALRRAVPHRRQFGIAGTFGPHVLLGVIWLILLIDVATYIGWIRGIGARREPANQSD